MYLEHNEFDLETDNQALSWVLARPRKSGRLARWVVRISQFKFVPRHIRSSQNVVADSLTRMYESQLSKREVSPEQSERVPVMPILSDFREY